jgi:hypothetical protein
MQNQEFRLWYGRSLSLLAFGTVLGHQYYLGSLYRWVFPGMVDSWKNFAHPSGCERTYGGSTSSSLYRQYPATNIWVYGGRDCFWRAWPFLISWCKIKSSGHDAPTTGVYGTVLGDQYSGFPVGVTVSEGVTVFDLLMQNQEFRLCCYDEWRQSKVGPYQ